MNRTTARLAAITGASTLFLLSASPALAAGDPVATSSATALVVNIAGQGADSGTVTASHNGTSQTVTGRTNPVVSVLNNQALANVGVLAQQATTSVNAQRAGVSRACAGVAGDGGVIVEVGDTSCLEPGKAVELSIGNLNLTGSVLVNPDSALAPLGALQPVIDQLVGPLTKAVTDALAPLKSGLVTVDLGAVSSWCQATAGATPSGNSSLVDAAINLEAAGKKIALVKLPVNPGPNTDLLVNLDDVVNAVLDGVEVQINEALDGALKPLSMIIDPVRANLVNLLLAQIAPQLKPLSDNVLKVTLNQQVATADTVNVTALSAEVLPAAKQFVGASLVEAKLAQVSCGPNRTVAPPTTPTTSPSATPTEPSATPTTQKPEVKGEKETDGPDPDKVKVPVTVAAGVSGEPEGLSLRNALMAGGIGLLAVLGLGSMVGGSLAGNRRSKH